MAGHFIQRSRHGTVFYFRHRVPKDLRGVVGRTHVYISLRTEELGTAKQRARFLAVATDRLFSRLRYFPHEGRGSLAQLLAEPDGPISPAQKNSSRNGSFPTLDHNNEERHQPLPMMEMTHPAEYTLSYGLVFERDSRGNPRIQITDAAPGEEAAIEDAAKRFLGLAKLSASSADTLSTPTISEAMQTVLDDPHTKASTKKEYRRAFKVFADYAGRDTRLGDLSQERFAEFADHVRATIKRTPKTQSLLAPAES